MKDLRDLYPRARDASLARGDRVDGEPLLGLALTRDGDEVVLFEGNRQALTPPGDRPLPTPDRVERCGPAPAERCAERDVHPAEDIVPGMAAAVDRCLDESGTEGAFVRRLMEAVPAAGHPFWLIGGAVRDLADIGPAARPNDLDFAGTLPPKALLREVVSRKELAGLGDYRHGLSPDSLVVHLAPPRLRTPRILEYKALAVTDFLFPAWGGDLREDVTSRDLTVNSLYYDHTHRVLADPTGLGLTHLRSRPRVLASLNAERQPSRQAHVLLRFLKFAVRHPDADVTDLVRWAAGVPAGLVGRIGEEHWGALGYAWRKGVPEEGRERALELAGRLGPATVELVARLVATETPPTAPTQPITPAPPAASPVAEPDNEPVTGPHARRTTAGEERA
ncbi:hypothetical protein ACGFXC_06345 [Streptomyces sp. NPDC048507]|uniref:hypothetical protein n=1 Tax=Streptomyces sp. NPDC048507 TaxID=3365560 RepID=UPI0037241E44